MAGSAAPRVPSARSPAGSRGRCAAAPRDFEPSGPRRPGAGPRARSGTRPWCCAAAGGGRPTRCVAVLQRLPTRPRKARNAGGIVHRTAATLTPIMKASTRASPRRRAGARNRRRAERLQHAPGRNASPSREPAGGNREQAALDQLLAHEPPAIGAERGARRELALPRFGAREQQRAAFAQAISSRKPTAPRRM